MSIKKYELKPTEQNIYNSFIENTLARNKYVWRLCKLLNEIDDSCVLALNGSWGEGKTFFVKHLQMVLDTYNDNVSLDSKIYDETLIRNEIEKYKQKDHYEKSIKKHICFYYDAWENDDDEEPIISMMYHIAEKANVKIKKKGLLKQLLLITDQFTPLKIKEVVDEQNKKDILVEKKEKERIKQIIHDYLETLNIKEDERAVIVIDELDRCKPTYAVKLLERIKHYFDCDNITFVFSVNLEELQHTVKKYYGNEFDGYGYLSRFFDHVLELPEADIEYYLERINLDYYSYRLETFAKIAISKYKLSIREAEKYVRTLRNAFGEWLKKRNECLNEGQISSNMIGAIMIPLLLGLKMKNIKSYNAFTNGQGVDMFVDYISEVPEDIEMVKALLNNTEINAMNSGEISREKLEEERFPELYISIFGNEYKETTTSKRIGERIIRSDMKEMLINTCSMLSDYTLFDAD